MVLVWSKLQTYDFLNKRLYCTTEKVKSNVYRAIVKKLWVSERHLRQLCKGFFFSRFHRWTCLIIFVSGCPVRTCRAESHRTVPHRSDKRASWDSLVLLFKNNSSTLLLPQPSLILLLNISNVRDFNNWNVSYR